MYELMVVFIPDESYRGWVLEQAHGKVAPSLIFFLILPLPLLLSEKTLHLLRFVMSALSLSLYLSFLSLYLSFLSLSHTHTHRRRGE